MAKSFVISTAALSKGSTVAAKIDKQTFTIIGEGKPFKSGGPTVQIKLSVLGIKTVPAGSLKDAILLGKHKELGKTIEEGFKFNNNIKATIRTTEDWNYSIEPVAEAKDEDNE